MKINADLHSHSSYAGGVGDISLEKIAASMVLKGIDVFGSGDCLHPKWNQELRQQLQEQESGLFSIRKIKNVFYGLDREQMTSRRFVLQTELIFTYAKPKDKNRKVIHLVILFPSFGSTAKTIKLLNFWGVKNNIGRPFVPCANANEVANKLLEIAKIDDEIEIIPSHIMTPEGIFGSKNNINSLEEAFGPAMKVIHAVETGLSADPLVLNLIPELDNLSLISNSDCHSAGLDKLGREFTSFEVSDKSYTEIIKAIRTGKIALLAEFNPSEGKYFLSGHRSDRHQQKTQCIYSPKHTPRDKICPICEKKLNIGVLERAMELSVIQKGYRTYGKNYIRKEKYINTVPLLEIIVATSNNSSVSKKHVDNYIKIVKSLGNEANLWIMSIDDVSKKLAGVIKDNVIEAVCSVKKGNFCYQPPGFDGVFGKLLIGKKEDYLDLKIEPAGLIKQQHLLNFL